MNPSAGASAKRPDTVPRVAMITGAAGDIGSAIARELGRDGFSIALVDLARHTTRLDSLARNLTAAGSTAIPLSVDVTQKSQIHEAVRTAADLLGGFDVMVNNAGVSHPRSILDLTESDLDTTMRVNLYGVVFGIQAAAERFIEHGRGGTIISAASVSSYRGNPALAHYSASKFAVRGVTQAASRALGGHGITVNAYAPGIVEGEMWAQIDAELAAERDTAIGQSLEEASRDIALGRRAQPSDVAKVVSFLASEKAGYMTGQTVVVDGGIIYT